MISLPMLDPFTTGLYTKTLTVPGSDKHDELLGGPLGPTRQTVFGFSAAPNPNGNQPTTLDIGVQNGQGLCIVNSGFQTLNSLALSYGSFLNPQPAPLGLNLSKFSGVRLNFGGLSVSGGKTNAFVFLQSGNFNYDFQIETGSSEDPFSLTFPWVGFSKQPVPLNLNDIAGVQVEVSGGGFITFGILSFEAVL